MNRNVLLLSFLILSSLLLSSCDKDDNDISSYDEDDYEIFSIMNPDYLFVRIEWGESMQSVIEKNKELNFSNENENQLACNVETDELNVGITYTFKKNKLYWFQLVYRKKSQEAEYNFTPLYNNLLGELENRFGRIIKYGFGYYMSYTYDVSFVYYGYLNNEVEQEALRNPDFEHCIGFIDNITYNPIIDMVMQGERSIIIDLINPDFK